MNRRNDTLDLSSPAKGAVKFWSPLSVFLSNWLGRCLLALILALLAALVVPSVYPSEAAAAEDVSYAALYTIDGAAPSDANLATMVIGEAVSVPTEHDGLILFEGYAGIQQTAYTYSNLAPWNSYASSIASVFVKDEITPANTAYWFYGFSNCTSMNVANLDMSNVTDANNMFRDCSSLSSLDVSTFDTGNVVNMKYMFIGCTALQTLDLSNFDTSSVVDMNGMFFRCESLATLNLSDSFDTSKVTDMSLMFCDCSSLTSLDVSGFNTSLVGGTASMFSGCSSLTSLDLSGWDVSRVDGMGGMFDGCTSLKSLDLSNFNTSRAKVVSYMFRGCSSLESLDLSNFDTYRVERRDSMFWKCDKLEHVVLGSKFTWGTGDFTRFLPAPSADYIEGADGKWYDVDGNGFAPADVPGGKAMTYTAVKPAPEPAVVKNVLGDGGGISLPEWIGKGEVEAIAFVDSQDAPSGTATWDASEAGDWSVLGWAVDGDGDGLYEVTYGGNGVYPSAPVDSTLMFGDLESLSSLSLSSFNTSNVTSMNSMFYNCKSLETLDLCDFDTSNVTDMSDMFSECDALKALDFSSFNTFAVTDMNGMFFGCESLGALGHFDFDTSNVTDMGRMFGYCSSFASLDLSFFVTRNVTDMSGMFMGCESLESLDLSSFDTSSVTDMSSMFCSCSGLNSLNLSSFDTSNVTDMLQMFYECESLGTLNLSSFDTSNVTDMNGMFGRCGWRVRDLSLDLSNFDTRKVEDFGHMFWCCYSLKHLDISNFSMGEFVNSNLEHMFDYCHSLEEVVVGDGFCTQGKGCTGESRDLPTPSSERIFNATGKWRSESGESFVAADIGPGMAGIYYAERAVAAPIATGGLAYTGKEAVGVTEKEGYTVEGGTAVGAGSHRATATLQPAFVWDDGTDEPKVVDWSIAPAKLKASYAGEKVEWGAAPKLAVGVTGFVNGETAKTAAGYKAPAVAAPGNLEEGKSYKLTPTGGKADNYVFEYIPGTLTVLEGEAKHESKRLSGDTALETMVEINAEAFEDGSCDTLIVATVDGYWDALTASGLAGLKGCPILMTDSDELSAETRAEIGRLASPKGARIYVAGGPAAVSDGVVKSIKEMRRVTGVERLQGDTAVDTALKIYEEGKGSWGNTAVIATAYTFHDALSVSPYAYAKGAPIFLADSSRYATLSPNVVRAIKNGGFDRIVIAGGPVAVSDDVKRQLGMPSSKFVRLYGDSSIETSSAIAEWCIGQGMSDSYVAVATGWDYYDALAGAALCGQCNAPLILAIDGNRSSIDSYVKKHASKIDCAYVLGGPAAVSNATYDVLRKTLK